ncbi:hypothetical protein HK097_001033 [Rhizophlyctis rosea]|uniref:Uncharacterized protein n=1 Tax=Rhizophlyctis rosea TaxID=64517 RepID=A0AAD5SRJ9_9FUNG|nr:hypothetical protein HK097_001033 [Rhizophlyctis rosea]
MSYTNVGPWNPATYNVVDSSSNPAANIKGKPTHFGMNTTDAPHNLHGTGTTNDLDKKGTLNPATGAHSTHSTHNNLQQGSLGSTYSSENDYNPTGVTGTHHHQKQGVEGTVPHTSYTQTHNLANPQQNAVNPAAYEAHQGTL